MANETVVARATRRMSATPEEVFDAWLDPALIRRWSEYSLRSFGLEPDIRRVETDPRPGGSFCFSDMRDGEEAVHWGTYRKFDRPRTLQFTWFTSEEEEQQDLSLVTLELEPLEDGGASATLSHEMSADWAEYIEQTATAWEAMLSAIDEVLEGKS